VVVLYVQQDIFGPEEIQTLLFEPGNSALNPFQPGELDAQYTEDNDQDKKQDVGHGNLLKYAVAVGNTFEIGLVLSDQAEDLEQAVK
jgi:hypothetical protein